MVFAVVPWSDEFANDGLFGEREYRDDIMVPFVKMKEEFVRRGHEIHTIDFYERKYDTIDYFLFFVMNWDLVIDLIRMKMAHKMVYCNSEPPSVDCTNTPQGYKVYSLFFPYILTWNDDWIDNKVIFKRNDPYYFKDNRQGNLAFSEKKLITFISSNNFSDFPGELYSERRKAIQFFENNVKENFDFFGYGWNKEEHPCYRGEADNKFDIYHKYRFAICYENIKGYSGYISEKIFDCLVSGIVPIYLGANNIRDYVPADAYISFEEYGSYQTLFDYLKNVDEKEYTKYLDAADRFLKSSDKEEFSGERYAEYIILAVTNDKKTFRVGIKGYIYLLRRWFYLKRINLKNGKNY